MLNDIIMHQPFPMTQRKDSDKEMNDYQQKIAEVTQSKNTVTTAANTVSSNQV